MNCPRKLSRSPRIVSKWLNPGIVCLVISLACLSLPAAHFPPDFGRWPVATPESQGLSASRLEAAPAAVPHGMGRTFRGARKRGRFVSRLCPVPRALGPEKAGLGPNAAASARVRMGQLLAPVGRHHEWGFRPRGLEDGPPL
jgi:hypothetical protein